MKQSFKQVNSTMAFLSSSQVYQDQNFGHHITTCSSSYSLGDWLVIGVGAEENAAEQIKHYQKFTVNIPDENLMLEMEQAGFISHREKLKYLGQTTRFLNGLRHRFQRLVQQYWIVRQIGLSRKMESVISLPRLSNDQLIQSSWMTRGHFKNDRFAPTYFMGDGYQRVYRYLDDRVDSMGSFIRKARKKDGKN